MPRHCPQSSECRSSHGSWLFEHLRAFEQILLFVHSCRSSYDSKVLGQVLNTDSACFFGEEKNTWKSQRPPVDF
ncbi:hypothetical protein LBK6_10875 [Leptospira borgpetersenii serovar Hardjo]|nr:hypothetical protein LBK6_10875 [Leptospira borgpetersenii serovar Hardjo]AMX62070.1 hypothetical protein LBK9_10915 [Leptospira borgpetersenii serovar Hardjo]AMX68523.1 hypothetical protein LBHA_10770 [Leptospira borgpetersenii serovar Hardjo]AMX70725.1 hypothetical protein LBHB_05265 [Leptospira borgpetersenii serovar Hardjo]